MEAKAPGSPYPPPRVRWYATVLLAFLFWMSVLDRFVISLLVDPIKADLNLSDVQFGVLQGFAFVVSMTVFGFVFGALADRKERRLLIYIGITLWSIASAACGLAQNFWHLLFARAGLGAGEAALNPCATSMIGDLFPREKVTSAMAVYALGATVGGGTALMLGGAIIHWVEGWGDIILPFIGQVSTWQMVFFIVGLPGVLLAFVIFTIPEPSRRDRAQGIKDESSLIKDYATHINYMKRHSRFFLCHHLGFMLAGLVVIGSTAWYPVHMMRAFEWGAGRVGITLGGVVLAAGIVGKLICGWSVDVMYRRGYRDGQMRWYAMCLGAGIPLVGIAVSTSNPWVFVVFLFLFKVVSAGLVTCASSGLIMATPNQLRGTSSAVFTTIMSLAGGALGTLLVPLVSDIFFEGPTAIGSAIVTLAVIVFPLSVLTLSLGLGAMRQVSLEIEGAQSEVADNPVVSSPGTVATA